MRPTYLTEKQISYSQKRMNITLTVMSIVQIGEGREVIFIRVDVRIRTAVGNTERRRQRRGSRGRILDSRNKGQGAVGRPLMVIESCRYVIT
jgi:hypothetical protein